MALQIKKTNMELKIIQHGDSFTVKPRYRFKAEIRDELTGKTVKRCSTYVGVIEHGKCDTVEKELTLMLSALERSEELQTN